MYKDKENERIWRKKKEWKKMFKDINRQRKTEKGERKKRKTKTQKDNETWKNV